MLDFDGVVAQSTNIKYTLLLDAARHVGMTDLGPLVTALDSELNGADRARVGRWVAEYLHSAAVAESFVDHFTREFAARSQAIDPITGFSEFVDSMRRNEIRVCIVSLAPTHEIRTWLSKVVEPDAFVGIFGIEQGPKPQTTRLALARIGTVDSPVICIGDTPADLAAATGAGCRFIRMRSPVGDRCDWTGKCVPTATSFTHLCTEFGPEFGSLR